MVKDFALMRQKRSLEVARFLIDEDVDSDPATARGSDDPSVLPALSEITSPFLRPEGADEKDIRFAAIC